MKRAYSVDFKREVIPEALETETYGKVARRFQLNTTTISRWVREYRQGKHELSYENVTGGTLRGNSHAY